MAHAAIPMAAKAAGIAVGGGVMSKLFGKPPGMTSQGTAASNGLFQNAGLLRSAGQSALAGGAGMMRAGQAQVRAGDANLNGASNYFRALVNGNDAATAAAVAPQVGQISQVYRGARTALDRSNVRGPIRELTEGDMARERAGQISGLVLQQRPGAIAGLVDLERGRQQVGLQQISGGLQAQSTGVGALSGASGPLGAVYGGELRRAEAGADNQRQIGQFFANLLYDYLKNGKAA